MKEPSQYTKDRMALEAKKCETCRGIGECSDAEDGGMYCSYWRCPTCKGSGYKSRSKNVPVESHGFVAATGASRYCAKCGLDAAAHVSGS